MVYYIFCEDNWKSFINSVIFLSWSNSEMEEFFISEVFPASSITDATIITNFFELNDALAVARGNRLVIYKIEDQYLQESQVYELYGEIMKLIPILYSHPAVGNLLVILADYQVCIIGVDENDNTHIKTLKNGTIMPSCDEHLPPLKYALHPNAVVLQILHSRLDVFPITSNSTLEKPFQVEIGCKRIIDFHFIGPTAKVTRLAVLTEEFNKAPTLRLIEIDSSNGTFNEDLEKKVTLPYDTYLLIPYDPENQSIIVAFSTQQAIRVIYSNLNPIKTTATIFTKDPLTNLLAMKPDFYIAIDEPQNLRVVKLEKEGPVHFIDVGKCPKPSCVAAISSTLAFIGSEVDDSVIYTIEEDQNSSSAKIFDTIQSTGPCIKFFKEGHNIYSIFSRAVVVSKLISKFRISLKISCTNFTKVFPFIFEDDMTCYLLSTSNSTKIMGATLDGEFIKVQNKQFCYEYPTLYFTQIKNQNNDSMSFLQITEKKILLFTPESLLSSIEIDDSIISASFCENTFAYSTVNSFHIYELNFDSDQIFVEKKLNLNYNPVGEFTSVSITDSFLAISTSSPNCVYIFKRPDPSLPPPSKFDSVEYQKYDTDGTVIDLAFAFGHLLALDIMNKVYVIDYLNNEKFEIKNSLPNQFNSSFCRLSNDEILVCGESPFIINTRFEFLGVKLSSGSNNCIIHASQFEGNLIGLNAEGLLIGSLQSPSYENDSYVSETPIIDIFNVGEVYITVRKITIAKNNSNGNSNSVIALFASFDKLEPESDVVLETIQQDQLVRNKLAKGQPFFTLNENKYIGYYIEKDNIFIGTSQRVLRFKVGTRKHLYDDDDNESTMRINIHFCGQKSYIALDAVNKQQNQKQQQQQPNTNINTNQAFIINGFGTFRDYLYIQYEKQIFFYAVDISNPLGCELSPMFTLKSPFKDKIVSFACSNLLSAIYTVGRFVVAYTFDEFLEKFVPLPPHQSFIDISAIEILGRKIVCATNSGNIFTLKHICSTNLAQADFVVDEAICVGEYVTKLTTFSDIKTTMIGTRKGMVMILRSLKMGKDENQIHNQNLYPIYQLLAHKMTSLGMFSKQFQRTPRENKYITTGRTIFDLDLIKRFLSLSQSEQEKILGSKFTIDEVKKCFAIDAIY